MRNISAFGVIGGIGHSDRINRLKLAEVFCREIQSKANELITASIRIALEFGRRWVLFRTGPSFQI